jgi:pentatricopeptide repeat protein
MILNMKDTTDDATVALSLFEESQRLGVRPNVYLFNTLISKLSRARRAKVALEYFELMKQYGLVPSSITYGAIINACCKIGDDLSADHLFNEMVSRPDFKPRVPPYNTMLQHFTSTKPDRKRALHYYDLLVKAGVSPTAHTYKLLLDAYGSTGDVPDLEAVQQVFARLVKDRRIVVSGAHWASLITAYGISAKDVDRAISIFDSIAFHPTSHNNPTGPLPDAVVYEALLNALIANGRAELSDKYLAEMRDKGVRMTAYVANTLIKVRPSLPLFFSLLSLTFFLLAGLHRSIPLPRRPRHLHRHVRASFRRRIARQPPHRPPPEAPPPHRFFSRFGRRADVPRTEHVRGDDSVRVEGW